MKDRKTKRVAVKVLDDTTKASLHGFVDAHRAGEYGRGMAHTNGVERLLGNAQAGAQGRLPPLSVKHLQRYVSEFAGRHDVRDMDTLEQMQHVLAGMVGRSLL